MTLTSLVALAVMSESNLNASEVIRQSWNKTLVVGHRGAADYAPENTLPAFEKAVESQAMAAECDIHMSKDGVPMVIHDKTLKRTFPVDGVVAEMTVEELKKIGVPTLRDYIEVLRGKVVQVIEIKDGKGVVPAVIQEVLRAGTERETIIFSFNADFVKQSKELAADIPAVWLVAGAYAPDKFDEMLGKKIDCRADAVGFQFRNVTPELAAFLRRDRVPLFVWTVPTGAEVDRLKSLRVNFIITDSPNHVREQLGS